MEVYEDAEFYDLEFASRNVEIPFFLRHARLSKGPVLDIACGTGRITLPIAREGIDVIGIDISHSMLELARRKSAAEGLSIDWIQQDCRRMLLPRKVGLAFMATNAMQHLLDRDSVLAFLESTRRSLQPNGRLILDVFNPEPSKLERPAGNRHSHKRILSPDGEQILVEVETAYDPETRILQFDLVYLLGGNLLRTKHVNLRCFFPEEILELCDSGHFRVCERYGDYEEQPFVSTSPKQILVCDVRD
jgi:SAM-dependent methyltransferase